MIAPFCNLADISKRDRYYYNVFMSGDLTGLCLYIDIFRLKHPHKNFK